ncbi:MAG: tRNA 2-thiocytidine biosynthesis protein TtcA [Candidatus Parabeggiatoa sp. nov. 3]|nr:MAG: tRNA 2-thiocytidine biosynthesis protein TtcA [Gammaproteobacteria bacterium]RKZ69600.1 MAG: tRNA 2-thiocytidine biosynthesis protein TtcA [Gammaproteobacteria bacterium]RKZ90255.1 MAG: tRNA 2-thiocytidine biosynthesis protein TtcA [Gammaproteobacteria bacterium]
MSLIKKPPKLLLRRVGRALTDYAMIENGDKVLLGLSGGKDSLSLLHILAHLQRYAPIRFELGALTVDPQIPSFDPSPLKDYLEQLSIDYYYIKQPIMEEAKKHLQRHSFCAYCARMKRGIMYRIAREQGYNVLALAQHLDDLAESFLMSALYNGSLRTMKAQYINDAADVRVIRPLVYVRERQTAAFAEAAQLPVVQDSCPACFTVPTQREHIKTLLAEEEKKNEPVFQNLLHAMRPLMVKQVMENGKLGKSVINNDK